MKKYILFVLAISIFFNSQLFSQDEPKKKENAEPKKSTKSTVSMDKKENKMILDSGLIEDFYLVEEYWVSKHKFPAKEFRMRTLEKNLKSAIKYSLHRKFMVKDYEEKGIDDKVDKMTLSKIDFRQEPGTFNYYLKVDDHIYFYNFAADPELYIQNPQDERVYEIPPGGIPDRRKIADLKQTSQERLDKTAISSKEKTPVVPKKPNIDSKQ